ncbi:MAG TPA: DUF6036 family nucleotidyltransferase [Candidatus Nanoarchaeia archaeon]|nr:DUF6036 family nucleotidyltransferase [Candidatus Nanoarchaeia archaeon]
MITIVEQQNLLTRIAEKLPKKIEVYAIGGTAMMFLGLKQTTVDVDLVFSNVEDRVLFKETIHSLGFKNSSAEIVYGRRENTPEMAMLLDVRLDLFLFKILSSYFSKGMQQRAAQIHEFVDNLIVRVADPHDILIMKSVTSRDKDLDDIIAIVNNSRINWDLVVEEATEQVRLGNETAILGLGEKLEKLSNRKMIVVPKVILDRLWDLLSRQVKKKSRERKK